MTNTDAIGKKRYIRNTDHILLIKVKEKFKPTYTFFTKILFSMISDLDDLYTVPIAQ